MEEQQRSQILFGKDYNNLKGKRIVIIGVGGLGSTVSMLLARMGLFKLTLMDKDIVEKINLERQMLYEKEDVGRSKVDAAKDKLEQFCDVEIIDDNFDAETTRTAGNTIMLNNADLIMDCTDNVDSRLVINDYCKKNKIPWIYSGAIARLGSVFFVHPDGPCFECFNQKNQGEKCITAGILNSTVSFVASLAVSIALDYLAFGKIEKDLIRINLENNEFTKIKIKKNKNCCPT